MGHQASQEEKERARRSLERRVGAARVDRFQPLCYFDWNWSKRCNRAAVEAMMSLDFFKDATNAILVRPNEIGKPILVKNIAHHALINGHTLLFPTAGELLRSLATLGSDSALRRRLRYESPRLLVIDEIDYPSYSNRMLIFSSSSSVDP